MPSPSPVSASTLLSSLQIPSNASVHVDESQMVLPSSIVQTLLRPTIPSIEVSLHTTDTEADDEEEEASESGEEEEQQNQANTMIANALLSLLQIPTGTITRNYVMPNLVNGRTRMDQFLQPVVVHPTPEQIDANTTVGNLVSDTENSCAICQDSLTSDQEGRKLNACGHWFHKGCIDTWLSTNVHCPVCRHDIREPLQTNT